MQMMTPSSSGADVTTYTNIPTWDVWRVPRWYASLTLIFETLDGAFGGICLPDHLKDAG